MSTSQVDNTVVGGILVAMQEITFTLPPEFLPQLTETKLRVEQDMAYDDGSNEDKKAKAELVRGLRIGENKMELVMAEKFAAALGRATKITEYALDSGLITVEELDGGREWIELNASIVRSIAAAAWAAYTNEQKVKLVAAVLLVLPYFAVVETFEQEYGVGAEEIRDLIEPATEYIAKMRDEAELESFTQIVESA